jgi:hypothetical protein
MNISELTIKTEKQKSAIKNIELMFISLIDLVLSNIGFDCLYNFN